MSQFSYQPVAKQQESNGLAVAGFVCSLVGLLGTAGLLCPIGLIISLVALGKPGGKGFAVAGLILGLIGSCGFLLVLLLIPAAALALVGIGVVAIALAEPEKVEITSDMAHIAIAAKIYEEEQGVLPANLGVLELRETVLRDPWGNPYEYHFIDDDPGFDIISRGEDGTPGTEYDIYLTKLDETWEAAGNMAFNADANDDEGTVTLTFGNNVMTLHGDDDGGRITLDTGDKVYEITGDDDGGHFNVEGKDDDKDNHDDKHDEDDDHHDDEDHDDDEAGESDEHS